MQCFLNAVPPMNQEIEDNDESRLRLAERCTLYLTQLREATDSADVLIHPALMKRLEDFERSAHHSTAPICIAITSAAHCLPLMEGWRAWALIIS